MQRRTFLGAATSAAAFAAKEDGLPSYRVVTAFHPSAKPGMPGPYPGRVVSIHAARSIDTETEKVDAAVVAQIMARGMQALTGEKQTLDAWRRFFVPADFVGIKVNCSGAPNICSSPEIVAETVRNLIAAGVPARNITIYERFKNQMDTVKYERYVPEGVEVTAIGNNRTSLRGYDPSTYVEVDFFGEEETRSNMVRLVTERFTKIINIPNMKDHGASGVTGCLKNIAYGNFHNVARSHRDAKTHTYSFIGTLANLEPLRSRTVLQLMDGLKGVWHGGPFSPLRKFRFFPAQMMFGTDPVAIDRLLIDIIDDKRKAEGAVSVWDRSEKIVAKSGEQRADPNRNVFIRETGHIEFSARLGLGVYDKAKIRVEGIEI